MHRVWDTLHDPHFRHANIHGSRKFSFEGIYLNVISLPSIAMASKTQGVVVESLPSKRTPKKDGDDTISHSKPTGFLLPQLTGNNHSNVPSVPPLKAVIQALSAGTQSGEQSPVGQPGSDMAKEVAKMASIMMNLQYYDELDQHPSHLHSFPMTRNNVAEYSAQGRHHMSSATRARAVRARAKLELKYQIIETFQQNPLVLESSETGETREVPGKYNPLQTIRNRIAKKEQGKGYSGYLTGKPDSHMYDVDVAELVADFSWQIRYYRLMRNRQGKLLYPEQKPTSMKTLGTGGDELIKRFQSKITQRLSSSRNNSNDNSDSSPSRSDISDAEDSKKANWGGRRSRLPSATYSEDDPLLRTHSAMESQVMKQQSDRSTSPIRDIHIQSIQGQRKVPPAVPKCRKPSITNPSILLAPPSHTASINSSPDSSRVVSRITSVEEDSQHPDNHKSPIPEEHPKSKDEPTHTLEELARDLEFLEQLFVLAEDKFSKKPVYYLNVFDNKILLSEKISQQISETCERALQDLEPRTRKFLANASSQVTTIHQDLMHEKASKMDRIVTESDEIINEVSTVMTLELRRLGERLDKLERQTHGLKWLWNMGYMLLEWTLVILMWIAWGFVSVIRLFRTVSKLPFSFIRWLLWC